MSLAPLQFKGVQLRRLIISDERTAHLESEDLVVGFSFPAKREGLFPVYLEIDVFDTGRADIGTIKIAFQTLFSFADGTPEEVIKSYYPTLCVANSVSIARNLIAQATAVSVKGSYWLPFVNVAALVAEKNVETKKIKAPKQLSRA